jgi:hypothetical protein
MQPESSRWRAEAVSRTTLTKGCGANSMPDPGISIGFATIGLNEYLRYRNSGPSTQKALHSLSDTFQPACLALFCAVLANRPDSPCGDGAARERFRTACALRSELDLGLGIFDPKNEMSCG